MTSTADGLAIRTDAEPFTVAALRAHAADVALYLRDHGHPQAAYNATIGTVELDPTDATVTGLWAIRPRSARDLALAAASDQTTHLARALHRPLAVTIQKRREANVSEAYVLLSLADFAELAARVGDSASTAHTAQDSA